MPARANSSIAVSAWRKLPGTPRSRSCTASLPSTETPADDEAGLDRGLDLGAGQRAAAGLEPASDAGVRHRPDDVEPVAAQIGLAADQADLARAERGQLGDDRADLVERQLVAARPAGARAAMGAAQIAGEGQLPDDMDRMAAPPVELRADPDRLRAGRRHRPGRQLLSRRAARGDTPRRRRECRRSECAKRNSHYQAGCTRMRSEGASKSGPGRSGLPNGASPDRHGQDSCAGPLFALAFASPPARSPKRGCAPACVNAGLSAAHGRLHGGADGRPAVADAASADRRSAARPAIERIVDGLPAPGAARCAIRRSGR